MGFLVCISCYAAGLVNVLIFIAGWNARKRTEATGRAFGKTKEYDPIRNESLEARVEQSRDAVEAWEEGR